jgi:hypothetical protein
MAARRGTSLAALLLLVGAAALLSGIVRSIATGLRFPPLPPPTFWGAPQFPTERVIFLFILGSSVLIGVGCGIAVAARRGWRFRGLVVGVCGGCALGALAGSQLLSKGDFGMIGIGSLALVAFGFVIRHSATPERRTEEEIEWLRGDEILVRPATTGHKPQLGE